MKRSFSNKRVARKIGQNEDEDNSASTGSDSQEPVVKRPPLGSKVKKGSKLRLSFGPGPEDAGNEDDEAVMSTPKRSLGRQAVERNAERKTLRPAISSDNLSFRAGNEDRPSYSKDSLAELKLSTPSTPKDVSSQQASEDDEIQQGLDVASKFGVPAATRPTSSAIPSAAEIKEKKERRARLAQEKEFISLSADDSEEERRELLLRPKEKYLETRLVREDEDLAEGFDEYVEDGKISLGRKAEREERRRRRKEMEEMIAEAEGDVVEDEDDSEAERNETFEAAQTKAGTYGQHRDDQTSRPRTPPKITTLPELSAVLGKLKASLHSMQDAKAAKMQKLEELRSEKKEIAEREVWIQSQLKEVGERYENLRVEAGMAASMINGDSNGDKLVVNRGLESYGNTPLIMSEATTPEPSG